MSQNNSLNRAFTPGARRTSPSQFETMLHFLEQHPYLLSQNTDVPKEVRSKSWHKLTQKLNQDPTGPQKTDTLWRKTWKDWKCYVRNKARRVTLMRMQIKDGRRPNDEFSALEERLLNAIGEPIIKEELKEAHEEKDEESNIVFASARLKRLMELAKQQSKEIEEVGSLEDTKEFPVIYSVSSVQSDEEEVDMNGEEDEDSNDSDDSNEKARQTSAEVDIFQNSYTYPTTDEEQESSTSSPNLKTLYTRSAEESLKHKFSPNILNSELLFSDRSMSAKSRLKFTPSSLNQQQLVFIKRQDTEKTSSPILNKQRPLLERLAAIKQKRKATELASNASERAEADNTAHSRLLTLSERSKKASRVEEQLNYGTPSSIYPEHQQLFAEREAAARERRVAAEERLAAAEDRKAAAEERQAAAEERKAAAEERRAAAAERKASAEEKFLALEELKIAIADRKATAQERMASAAERKVAFLKRTLDCKVNVKKLRYF